MRMFGRAEKCHRGYTAGFKLAYRAYVWRRDLQESSGRNEEFGVIREVNAGNSGRR